MEPNAESIYYVFVIDAEEHLRGVLSLRDLIVAQPDTRISSIMIRDVIAVHVNDGVQEVAAVLSKYNLLAVPVVDDAFRIQGLVTVDDALDAVLPEAVKRKLPKARCRRMTRLAVRLRRFRRLFILLAVIGPGLITTNAGNDAGAIATYSQAGAEFGYQMLWILALITVSLAVVNEMGARMAVVTGKGLADLIRERFGVRGTAIAMLLLL